MKFVLLLALVVAAIAKPQSHYDSKYDSFNVDELTSNTRLLKSYAHCFLGDGKCTPDGTTFKNWMPEAVATSCGKCTEKQKVLVAKVMKALMKRTPHEWDKLKLLFNTYMKGPADLDEFLNRYAN